MDKRILHSTFLWISFILNYSMNCSQWDNMQTTQYSWRDIKKNVKRKKTTRQKYGLRMNYENKDSADNKTL